MKFDKFNDGLRRLGVQRTFWDYYKALKGDTGDRTESYAAYIERKQIEQAREEGLINETAH